MPVNTGNTVITAKGMLDIGAIGIAGSVLGMPVEIMVVGAVFGGLANGLNPPEKRRTVLLSVAASMFLAGTFAPLLAHWLSLRVDLGDSATEMRLLNGASAAVIGGGWSWFAPLLGDGIKQAWEAAVAWVVGRFGGKGAGK